MQVYESNRNWQSMITIMIQIKWSIKIQKYFTNVAGRAQDSILQAHSLKLGISNNFLMILRTIHYFPALRASQSLGCCEVAAQNGTLRRPFLLLHHDHVILIYQYVILWLYKSLHQFGANLAPVSRLLCRSRAGLAPVPCTSYNMAKFTQRLE